MSSGRVTSLAVVGAVVAVVARPVEARLAPREIVIANEALRAGGASISANLDAFLRRLERVAGWKPGSLRGKAFPRPSAALDYLRAGHGTFAILPVHQLAEGRRALKLRVVGRAVGLDGTQPTYWGVSRNAERPYNHIEDYPGLRLAATEIADLQWINVLFDGNIDPRTHFKYVAAETPEAALEQVVKQQADVALLYETDFNQIRTRVGDGRELMWVYTSPPLPPPPVVAVGKRATTADVKALARALPLLCKDDGATACARMAILYAQSGHAETYEALIEKYERYRLP